MIPRSSSRLKSNGYYQGDEMAPVISYRETPLRRQRRQRKANQSVWQSAASNPSSSWGDSWPNSSDCWGSDTAMTSTRSSSSACTVFGFAVKKTLACLLVVLILSFGFCFLNASDFVKTSHLHAPLTVVPPPATTMQDFELKEGNHVSEMFASLTSDFRTLDKRMKNLDRMQPRQLAGLSLEADRLGAESLSASELLRKEVAAPEVHAAKVNEELLSIKQQIDPPPPASEGKQNAGCRPLADSMADFALESEGAGVMEHWTSETYRTRPPLLKIFGVSFYWWSVENPHTVIQGHPEALPGRCWAFAGGRGHIAISLSSPVAISHVTLDHIRKSQSPYGHIDSAPRKFSAYGINSADDATGTWLGSFEYDQDGGSTQTFQLHDSARGVYKSAKLVVESNWGHPDYTCLYRFRVHGEVR